MAAPRPSVSKEVFLEAALTIADQFGPDALTTRSLGNAVGLDATTVYRYFGNKDALLGELFDYVTGKVLAQIGTGHGSPRERIVAVCAAYRTVFFEHPSVARLNSRMADMIHTGQGSAPNTMALSAIVVNALREMGLSGRNLIVGYQMVESFIVGAIMLESEAHGHGMEVRMLRYRAFASGASELENVSHDAVVQMSEDALWSGVDAVLDAVEKMADADTASQ